MALGASTRAVTTPENIARAWLWTKTNGDRAYKSYFRDIYRAFSLAEAHSLLSVRSRLISGTFEPSLATKLFVPKASGVLRPLSLLVVEDQIVYQSFANIIAERLRARVGARYNQTVFGHLYAGKDSRYFYRDWRKSYRLYTNAMQRAYQNGYRYTASFDLTACYDSIDHTVLKHFLADLGLDAELCDALCRLLSHWTETSGARKPLYHGHGLPQGPLPSGLLAECVLRYFDDTSRPPGVRYFRYVDDIRLFGTSENALRRELLKLDIRSKEVGLFPQASKIDIHRVMNINDEMKSVSRPPEPALQGAQKDQARIVKRLVALSPGFRVSDPTRFKYLLGAASPNARLTRRLLRIVRLQPHFYEPVFRHIAKVPKLGSAASRECIELLKGQNLYPALTAAVLVAIDGAIHSSYQTAFTRFCSSRLSRNGGTNDPELRVAAASVLIRENALPWTQVQFNVTWKKNWWVRSQLLPLLDSQVVGEPNLTHVTNVLVRDPSVDVSVVAAEVLLRGRLKVARPINEINASAQAVFKQAGIIGKITTNSCPIRSIVSGVLGPALRPVRWRRLFSVKDYNLMVKRFVAWKAYSTSDPTAWVAMSDVINDVVLANLFPHDGTIGGYQLGNVGGAVWSATSAFALKYPKFYQATNTIHGLRLEADLVHSLTKATKKPTRRITFAELPKLKRLLAQGYWEMWQAW